MHSKSSTEPSIKRVGVWLHALGASLAVPGDVDGMDVALRQWIRPGFRAALELRCRIRSVMGYKFSTSLITTDNWIYQPSAQGREVGTILARFQGLCLEP